MAIKATLDMSKNRNPEPSVDEIVAMLMHSNLPTVVIEGKNDLIALRPLEHKFNNINLSLLPVGGRDRVLQIFSCMNNHSGKQNRICFVADQDIWAIYGIPDKYVDSSLIFTDGYSMENDLYRDGQLEKLMSPTELSKFRSELNIFLGWFCITLARNESGESFAIDTHPNVILDKLNGAANTDDGEVFPQPLFDKINADYRKMLRGKSLLALLMRQLSYKGRLTKHNDKALMEVASTNNGAFLVSICSRIEATLVLS